MIALLCGSFLSLISNPASADGEHFWSGGWYLNLGAAGIRAPEFQGSKNSKFTVSPIIAIGRQGKEPRFSSRNDSPSLGLFESDAVRVGIAGKFIPKRDGDTSADVAGLSPVKYGLEIGGFAEVYPVDWMRVRGELRQGIRSHDGVVGDLSADAFADLAPNLRLSAGPRATYGSKGYSQAYYGVDAGEAAASGLSAYNPDGGWQSAGLGTALTLQATDNLQASLFGEYRRLTGPAADSSLVRERGTKNQLMIGVSASYKFNFGLK